MWAATNVGNCQPRSVEEVAGYPGESIVQKVDNWLEGRTSEKVRLDELCKMLAVSRRSLQRAFTETLGMGPVRYVMLKRMSAARAKLSAADPLQANVRDIAWDHGFWELGRFSSRYRQLFGERPSDTLKKRT